MTHDPLEQYTNKVLVPILQLLFQYHLLHQL